MRARAVVGQIIPIISQGDQLPSGVEAKTKKKVHKLRYSRYHFTKGLLSSSWRRVRDWLTVLTGS